MAQNVTDNWQIDNFLKDTWRCKMDASAVNKYGRGEIVWWNDLFIFDKPRCFLRVLQSLKRTEIFKSLGNFYLVS